MVTRRQALDSRARIGTSMKGDVELAAMVIAAAIVIGAVIVGVALVVAAGKRNRA